MLSSSLAGSRTIARPALAARPSVAAAGLRIRRAQRPSRLTMHADKAAVSPIAAFSLPRDLLGWQSKHP